MMVGDFNATRDHATFRRLLDTGLEDSARQANSGWQPTWPVATSRPVLGIRLPFALVTIDHVLVTAGFAALSTQTHTVAGSDHVALLARPRTG